MLNHGTEVTRPPDRGKRGPALVIALALFIVISPVAENFKRKPVDSFPLSYFPMFSFRRSPVHTGNTLIGIDDAGHRTRLRAALAGTGGFNQIRRQIQAKVKAGRAQEICETVAARVSRARREPMPHIRTVQVLTVKHEVDAFFSGDQTAVSETVQAACEVPEAEPLAHNRKERP
ncbi:MAG: hypothetical protein IPM24_24010 [Bryobacterales bacterium]|nr:hypothetical protein [Bryobacterales bacterium]